MNLLENTLYSETILRFLLPSLSFAKFRQLSPNMREKNADYPTSQRQICTTRLVIFRTDTVSVSKVASSEMSLNSLVFEKSEMEQNINVFQSISS